MRLFAVFLAFMPTLVFAGFGVATGASSPPPDDGFAREAEYDDAVNGRTILSPAEKRELQQFTAKPINNSYYLRGEFMQAKQSITGFKQYPSPSYSTGSSGSASALTLTEVSTSTTPYGVAWGYKGANWRWEIEYYHLIKMQYVAHPVVTTPIPTGPMAGDFINFDSKISGEELLFNVMRDFPMIFYISPYIGAGVGFGYHTMNTTATDATTGAVIQSKINHNLMPNLNGVLGLRLRLLESLWLNGGYRYLWVYHGARANVADVSLKASHETARGIIFGLDWQY